MKLVTVEDLKDGDIIANDVMLEDYTVVLTKGTVIKAVYIEKLRELDIFTVYIEDAQELPEAPAQETPKAPETPKATKAPEKPQPKPAPEKKPVEPVPAKKMETNSPSFQWRRLQFCVMKWRRKSRVKSRIS